MLSSSESSSLLLNEQVGIALVGMSSLLSREGGTQDVSAKQMALGMALIVMSQVTSIIFIFFMAT